LKKNEDIEGGVGLVRNVSSLSLALRFALCARRVVYVLKPLRARFLSLLFSSLSPSPFLRGKLVVVVEKKARR
jgi:hypothetical protein